MESPWLRCKVSPGQFSGEFVVQAEDFRGNGFSLFVPDRVVECDSEPSLAEECVDGWVQVECLEKQDDLVLVRLPRAPLENGPVITARDNQLEFRCGRELA